MTPTSTSTTPARSASSKGRTFASITVALVASWAPPQPAADDTIEPTVLVEMEERVVAAAEKALAASVGLKIRENRTEGDGSGVIVSPDGYVLTVAHNFTEPGTPITVYFPDGRQMQGIGLGRNERGDYALAKIIGEGPFPFVDIGDSDGLERNELCVMLGHAGGIVDDRPPVVRVGTFTRRIRGYWLRSECAMMPGDSGGALFDLDGNVVGINSYIEEQVDANFHVPVSRFADEWDRLVAGESWNWTRDSRRARGRDFEEGGSLGLALAQDDGAVVVEDVIEAYRADEAGIEEGDRILRVNGNRATTLARYWSALHARDSAGRAEMDEEFTLTVERDGETLEIVVPYVAFDRRSR